MEVRRVDDDETIQFKLDAIARIHVLNLVLIGAIFILTL